jgi:glycosyltransferase involved in cell wall biosynthesis
MIITQKKIDKEKNVLHILPAYFNCKNLNFESIASYGGAERYASELALATSKIMPTALLTFGDTNYIFYKDKLKIIVLKSKPILKKYNGNTEFMSLKMVKIIKHYEIIHAHQHFTDTTLLAGVAAKIYHKKIFSTDLGFTGLNLARFFPMQFIINRILCLTTYDVKRLRLDRKKSGIIYAGVDLNKYKYTPRKRSKVIFIGRLLPHKGIDYLIDALEQEQECIIAGHAYDKKYYSYLKFKARHKKITFLESPSDKKIIAELKEASVLVLPSVDIDYLGHRHKNPELFGLVVAEAFACGTPVIVSNSSALPYVVENNVDGFIVSQNNSYEIASKIDLLIHNPEKLKDMGKNGRIKAEKLFNWNEVAKLAVGYYCSETHKVRDA